MNNLKTNTVTTIIIMLLGFENTDGTDVCTLHNCIHIEETKKPEVRIEQDKWFLYHGMPGS